MSAIKTLTTLGLNQLEAEVYILLLTSEPLTGYRIAKELGKPAANVYKALDALRIHGAVLTEEGDSRLCRAVPADEFLAQRELAFQRQKADAAAALAHLTPGTRDERVYFMERPEQVIERARRMLAQAEKFVVADLFPKAFAAVRPQLEAAVRRGVRVLLQVYKPTQLKGAEIILTTQAQEIVTFWEAEQLNLVCDGRELLITLLNADLTAVHQAIWSQSLYLATIMQIGLAHEHHTHQLLALQPNDNIHQQLQQILDLEQFDPSQLPGLGQLFARYQRAP